MLVVAVLIIQKPENAAGKEGGLFPCCQAVYRERLLELLVHRAGNGRPFAQPVPYSMFVSSPHEEILIAAVLVI